MALLKQIYRVRVVYKSGYTHDFDCLKFKITDKTTFEWVSVSTSNQPVLIGVDDIAAVWQIGTRYRLAFLPF